MNTIMDFVRGLLEQPDIRAIAVLILLDVVFGVAAAIKTQTYEWQKLGQFLYTNVLPYLIVYSAVKYAISFAPEWTPFSVAVFGVIVVTLLGSIADDLKQLGINIPIPGV